MTRNGKEVSSLMSHVSGLKNLSLKFQRLETLNLKFETSDLRPET